MFEHNAHCTHERLIVRSAHALEYFIRREKSPPFCAADIFVVDRGPSARTCLSYAVFQTSIEGSSEFSRRPIHNRNISDNKPKK
jgi:hypothetical protein